MENRLYAKADKCFPHSYEPARKLLCYLRTGSERTTLGLKPAGITYFDSGHLVLDAAAEGLGVAFMLESHLGSSLHDRLVRLFQETAEAPYAYSFVCLPVALSRRPVRLFHDWLFDRFAAE